MTTAEIPCGKGLMKSDSPITSKIERESTSIGSVCFFYHIENVRKVNVTFHLQKWHLVYKTGFSMTKVASRLQIFSF